MDKPVTTTNEINVALMDLTKATMAFNEADEQYKTASRERTARINQLNQAQKKIDELFAKARNEAPRDSDWSRSQQRSVIFAGAGE